MPPRVFGPLGPKNPAGAITLRFHLQAKIRLKLRWREGESKNRPEFYQSTHRNMCFPFTGDLPGDLPGLCHTCC